MTVSTHCQGLDLPVGKVLCVGRNYAAHAVEMGAERPTEPLLFLKPATSLLLGGGEVVLPTWSAEIHHEVEMVVRIGRGGKDLDVAAAGRAVDAYGVGIDLTARDVQARAKKSGHPWSVAKGFDGAAPLSSLVAVDDVNRLADLEITLEVDGASRQSARTSAMLWSVPELVAFASSRMRLEPGDLLFTGTPEGVGPVVSGQRLDARLGEAVSLTVTCRDA